MKRLVLARPEVCDIAQSRFRVAAMGKARYMWRMLPLESVRERSCQVLWIVECELDGDVSPVLAETVALDQMFLRPRRIAAVTIRLTFEVRRIDNECAL